MGRFLGALVLVLMAVPTIGFGEAQTIRSRTETFDNPGCAATDSCDLKKFSLKEEDYKLTIQFPQGAQDYYGTRMFAAYEVDAVANVEKYGLVQFLRGCQYSSSMKDGALVKDRDVEIEHYGKTIPFLFPDFRIDGFVRDPLSWGAEDNANRHFFYLNKFVGSRVPKPEDYYGVGGADKPLLYVKDFPGVAAYHADSGSAKNIALEFNLCLYKSADVPVDVADDKLDFAKPLHCIGWHSSFVYDHAVGKFNAPDSPASIDDSCR